MTIFQLLMLGASAYFALKIYEHIGTLKKDENNNEIIDTVVQDEAVKLSAIDIDNMIESADEAFENEDYTKALSLLKDVDESMPNDSDILFKIAYILQQLGKDIDAMTYYKSALHVDRDNEYIHNAIASLYRKRKEYSSARNHIEESIKIDSENPLTYYNFGNLMVDMDNKELAIEMYKKAIELKSDFTQAIEELEKIQKVEVV